MSEDKPLPVREDIDWIFHRIIPGLPLSEPYEYVRPMFKKNWELLVKHLEARNQSVVRLLKEKIKNQSELMYNTRDGIELEEGIVCWSEVEKIIDECVQLGDGVTKEEEG